MRARKPKVVKENGERWLLTYSDLITLLLVFFIILYSISTTDARKFQDLTGALQEAFNNGAYQIVTVNGSPGTPRTAPPVTPPSPSVAEKRLLQQFKQLLKMLGVQQDIATVGLSREGLVISLSGNLLFYPGGAQLQPKSLSLLGHIVGVLRHIPNQVRVEGNTDDQSSGPGTASSNWALSALRAVSIVEFMSSQGMAPTRLQAEGLGQYHPVASNSTTLGRAKNRHADIVILYPAPTTKSATS